jgi:hypothetical protein
MKAETNTTTTTIHASVKITPKINGVFYSFEYGEERSVPENCDLEKERQSIFDTCYQVVYNQIEETTK